MLNAVKCEQTNSRSLTSISVHGYKKKTQILQRYYHSRRICYSQCSLSNGFMRKCAILCCSHCRTCARSAQLLNFLSNTLGFAGSYVCHQHISEDTYPALCTVPYALKPPNMPVLRFTRSFCPSFLYILNIIKDWKT